MSEILGVLFKYLVALLGVSAVVMIAYQVFSSNKTQAAITDLTTLQVAAQSLYSGQSSFATLTNAIAVSAKLAPSDMITGAATLSNPWGGVVTIAGAAAQFTVTETLVPAYGCAKMATSMNNVVALTVNGVVVALPVDAGTATTACSPGPYTMVATFSH